MTDQERLEIIKDKQMQMHALSSFDINWLIEHVERAQKLGSFEKLYDQQLEESERTYAYYKRQIKHYREALEVAFLRLSNKYDIDETRDDILKALEESE